MTRQGSREEEGQGGGEDTVEIDVFGRFGDRQWVELEKRLDEMRAAAEGSNLPAVAELGGEGVTVQPSGAFCGVYYRWIVTWYGGRLMILGRNTGSDKTAAVRVELASLPLMQFGLDECWRRLCELLGRLGFAMHWHRMSRVDLCVDLPGQGLQPFIEAALGFCYVSKGRRGAMHYADAGEWEGWSHGTGPVHMRIYDKLREVRAKQDWPKLHVLVEKRWGGVEPECATRVEFQLRRETLRDRWQLNTIEDYKLKRRQIIEWLTTEWIRFVDGVDQGVRENRNQTRCETLPLWEKVRASFFAWCGQNTIAAVVPRKVLRPAVVSIAQQVSGCMTTLMAWMGRAPVTLDELALETASLVRTYGFQAFQKAAGKLAAFEAERGVLLAGEFEGAS